MQEQLITFRTAKLAKEKGFNEVCKFHHYSVAISRAQKRAFPFKEADLLESYMRGRSNSELSNKRYSAPTQSLLQKWLREKHNIHVNVSIISRENEWLFKGEYTVLQYYRRMRVAMEDSYEEALEASLQMALTLIKI